MALTSLQSVGAGFASCHKGSFGVFGCGIVIDGVRYDRQKRCRRGREERGTISDDHYTRSERYDDDKTHDNPLKPVEWEWIDRHLVFKRGTSVSRALSEQQGYRYNVGDVMFCDVAGIRGNVHHDDPSIRGCWESWSRRRG